MAFKLKNVIGNKGFVTYRNDNTNAFDEFISEIELKFQNINTATKYFYLSATGGNDNNDGLTSTTAIKTTNKLVELLRGFWFSPVVVTVTGGEYDLDPLTNPRGFGYVAMNRWASLHWLGIEKTTITTGTVQAGSTTLLVQLSSIGSADLSGYSIEFTSGTLIGVRKTIKESTSTTVSFGEAVSSIPSAGNTFQIFEPAAVFKRNASVAGATSVPFGISAPSTNSGNGLRPVLAIQSVTNILFKNYSASLSGARLIFTNGFFLNGVMTRDFTSVLLSGDGATGDDGSWFGLRTSATAPGENSIAALSTALGLSTGGIISNHAGWGLGTDPALVTTLTVGAGAIRARGIACDTFTVQPPKTWVWRSGIRCRIQYSSNFMTYNFVDKSFSIGNGAGISVSVGANSTWGNAPLSGDIMKISGSTGISCTSAGRVAIGGSQLTIFSTTNSMVVDSGGTINFQNSVIFSGSGTDTKIGPTGLVSCLNVLTGITASQIQPTSSYTSIGDGFMNGSTLIMRLT